MAASNSDELFQRSQQAIPGGVNSPVRAFGSVGGTPRFVVEGTGPRIFDADGNRYLDYVCSWGPLIFGHAHPEIVASATRAVERGSTFGAPTEGEVELAEAVIERMPGVEQVRLVSSGTEAAMSAIRLARGATGRKTVIKFAGHYHGHSDGLLAAAGSGVAAQGLPGSAGVTPGAAADTIVLPWNDRSAVESVFDARGDDVAVLTCEPVAANMGVVPPRPGFLEFLREITSRHGALLAFDEVITGFRLAPGGAQEYFGVTPDLVILGKVLGGGFPLAAFGGSVTVMSELAPVGSVYQAGTLSGNPVAVAAGLTQLRMLDQPAYDTLDELADRMTEGLSKAFADAGVMVTIQRTGSLFSVFFTDKDVRDYRDALTTDTKRFAAFFRGMLARGHYLPPSNFEALFLSLAHTSEDVDATVAAAHEAAVEL